MLIHIMLHYKLLHSSFLITSSVSFLHFLSSRFYSWTGKQVYHCHLLDNNGAADRQEIRLSVNIRMLTPWLFHRTFTGVLLYCYSFSVYLSSVCFSSRGYVFIRVRQIAGVFYPAGTCSPVLCDVLKLVMIIPTLWLPPVPTDFIQMSSSIIKVPAVSVFMTLFITIFPMTLILSLRFSVTEDMVFQRWLKCGNWT